MLRHLVSRAVLSVPTLIGISILVFSMMQLVPGDPLDYMFTETTLTAENRALIRQNLGLDRPIHVQYMQFLGKAVQGDFGTAIFVQRPVTQIILEELPFTLRLAVFSMLLIVVLGLFFGIMAALNYNSWIDSGVMALAVSGLSMPDFWLGLMLILIFSVRLGWLPIFGTESLKVMLMPALVLGFRASAIISRMTRSGLLEVLNRDYVRTARAKGLGERAVVVRHALKNALIPVVTLLGIQFGHLLGGAVVIETVFARRGVGALTVNAVLQRDLPLAQGTVLFVAVVYVVINLAIDVLYAYIDPRIQY